MKAAVSIQGSRALRGELVPGSASARAAVQRLEQESTDVQEEQANSAEGPSIVTTDVSEPQRPATVPCRSEPPKQPVAEQLAHPAEEDRHSMACVGGISAELPAMAAQRRLHFDPTVGDCGAFFIVREDGRQQDAADTDAGSDCTRLHVRMRNLAPSIDPKPAGGHQSAAAVVLGELTTTGQPQQMPDPNALQHQKHSAVSRGAASHPCQSYGSAAVPQALGLGSHSQAAGSSAAGRHCYHPDRSRGSLMDLVAEVEDLISQNRAGDWNSQSQGTKSASIACSGSSAAGEHMPRINPQDDCSSWIGGLKHSSCV
jgi:hypothetical protein